VKRFVIGRCCLKIVCDLLAISFAQIAKNKTENTCCLTQLKKQHEQQQQQQQQQNKNNYNNYNK